MSVISLCSDKSSAISDDISKGCLSVEISYYLFNCHDCVYVYYGFN